jgi:chromate transporter
MKPSKPTFSEAFRFWLKLGFISFGGPTGQIAIMHEYLVDKKKWISESRFMHALNYCMLLPGPEAQQLATYIGWLLHGVRGGLMAGLLFIIPSLLILFILSITYVLFGKLIWVSAIFVGLKPAVVAIVLVALIKIGKRALLGYFHYAISLFSFIAIFFLNISFPIILLASIVVGLFTQKLFPSLLKNNESKSVDQHAESNYYINKESITRKHDFIVKSIAVKLALGIFLWLIPFALFFYFKNNFSFWSTLSLFFTKAAFVTFGGAYAVLPYVAQESVEKLNWLSSYEMIDGLALGETTPGPLIMVLVFVGFMAAFHQGNNSILDGTLGLFTTAFYTFLPSFILIFVGAPIIETTSSNTKLKLALSIVTASVVGVVLNLTIYFAQAVLFSHNTLLKPDWFAIFWFSVSFVLLQRFKFNMIGWIGISSFTGIIYNLLH